MNVPKPVKNCPFKQKPTLQEAWVYVIRNGSPTISLTPTQIYWIFIGFNAIWITSMIVAIVYKPTIMGVICVVLFVLLIVNLIPWIANDGDNAAMQVMTTVPGLWFVSGILLWIPVIVFTVIICQRIFDKPIKKYKKKMKPWFPYWNTVPKIPFIAAVIGVALVYGLFGLWVDEQWFKSSNLRQYWWDFDATQKQFLFSDEKNTKKKSWKL